MWNRINRWIAPPVFEGNEEKTRAASLTNTLLLIDIIGVVLFVGSRVALGLRLTNAVGIAVLTIAGASLVLLVLLRLGYVRFVGIALTIMLWFSLTVPMLSSGGIHDAATTGYFVIILIGGVVAGGRMPMVFTALCILTLAGAFYAEQTGLIRPRIVLPSELSELILMVVMLGGTGVILNSALRQISAAYTRVRRDAEVLSDTNKELESSRQALESQAGKLERQTRYLEASARVAQDAATILDARELLSRVVNLISEQFGFYHTGIYLLDAKREWVELRATSSEGGQHMPVLGHRVRIEEGNVISTVIKQGTHQLATDMGQGDRFLKSPHLPATRSELALPLKARGEIMGVLDVQSQEPQAFTQQDIITLESLAGQIAMAINNAHLFQRLEESLEAERHAYGGLIAEAWQRLLRTESGLSVLSHEQGVISTREPPRLEMKEALQRGEPVLAGEDKAALALPIKVRDQVIGVIDGRKPGGAGEWTQEEIEILQTLTDQLGVALESARLYQDTQRGAARERLSAQVTAHMRETLDVDAVLQTAVREISAAFGLVALDVRLGAEAETTQDGVPSLSEQ